MKTLFIILLSTMLSTSLVADSHFWGSILSFTKSAIIKSASVSGLEGLALELVLEEVVTEENLNKVVEIAEGKKAHRTDICMVSDDLGNIPMAGYIHEYRNY